MTSSQHVHVAVEAGPGLVARFGSSVVVIGSRHDDDAHESFTNSLLATLDAAGDQGAADTLAWDLAGLVTQYRESAPPFAAAGRTGSGYLLFVHGAARAMLSAETGDLELSGRGALTWVDRVVADPITSLTLTLSDAGAVHTDPRSDLRGGLVPGGGAVLTSTADEAPADEAPAVEAPAVEAPAVEAPADETPARLVSEDPEQTTDLSALRDEVAPTATHGVLVADDGQRIPLDRGYVLGREPQYDQAVITNQAAALLVTDVDNLISRVQAYLWVDAAGVHLRDADSANGTFVAAPGAADWVRLGEDDAMLPAGWSLRMGRRVYTHVAAET